MSDSRPTWWGRLLSVFGGGAKEGAPTASSAPRAATRFPDSLATIQRLCAVTEDVPLAVAVERLRAGALPGLRLVEEDEPELVQRHRYAASVDGIGDVTITAIGGEVVGIGVEVTTMTTAELQAHVERLVGQPFHVTGTSRALVADGSLISIHSFGGHPELVGTRQEPSVREFFERNSGGEAP